MKKSPGMIAFEAKPERQDRLISERTKWMIKRMFTRGHSTERIARTFGISIRTAENLRNYHDPVPDYWN